MKQKVSPNIARRVASPPTLGFPVESEVFSRDLDNASRELCECVTAFRIKVLVLSQGLCLPAGSRNLMKAKNKSRVDKLRNITKMKYVKGRSGLNPPLHPNIFIWFGKISYFRV